MSIDSALFLLVNGSETSPHWLTALALFVTDRLPMLLAGVAAGVFITGDRQVKHGVLQMVATVAIAWLMAWLGQHFIPIDRPFVVGLGKQWLPHATTHSFPSAHSSVAFGLAAAVVLTTKRVSWTVCAFYAALLIAWSRVYLGLHYPSDVLAGALVGAASGWLVCRVLWRHAMQPALANKAKALT